MTIEWKEKELTLRNLIFNDVYIYYFKDTCYLKN